MEAGIAAGVSPEIANRVQAMTLSRRVTARVKATNRQRRNTQAKKSRGIAKGYFKARAMAANTLAQPVRSDLRRSVLATTRIAAKLPGLPDFAVKPASKAIFVAQSTPTRRDEYWTSCLYIPARQPRLANISSTFQMTHAVGREKKPNAETTRKEEGA